MDNIVVLVDNREHALIAELGVQTGVQTASLILGDVQISVGGKLAIIIERKTISDLRASIVDGRYRDQMDRLSLLPSEVRVVYLLESGGGCFGTGDENLLSCCATFTLKNYNIINVGDVAQSAHYIRNLVSKICDEKYCAGGTDVKFAGKNRVCIKSPTDTYQVILQSIPGLGRNVISSIMERYLTIKLLSHASVDDLCKIPKVGRTTAVKITDILKNIFE